MGFAMMRLLQRQPVLAAAVIVGLMQGIYHFPVLILSGVPISILANLLFTISLRVVMTWIYLPTGGSILIAVLVHGMVNLVSSLVIAGINPGYFSSYSAQALRSRLKSSSS